MDIKGKSITVPESLKRVALVVVSVFLTLGVIEIVLRVTKLATDMPWVKGDPALGFKFIPNQTGTWVVGKIGQNKAQYHINSDGWNAVRDYREKRDRATTRIAVIGDSYVEALNVQPEATVAAVLERALLRTGRVEVYSFGISGASLSHYLAMMRYVRNRFSPDLYIINIVHNDFEESLATGEPAIYLRVRRAGSSYEEVPPQVYRPSLFRRIIGQSAVARYLVTNLKLPSKLEDIGQVFNSWRENKHRRFEANIDLAEMNPGEMKELVKYVFKKYLCEVDDDRKKLVLVIDTPRGGMYKGTDPHTSWAFQYNKLTTDVCRDLSLCCLDLTDYFWEDFQRNKRRFNSEIDGHWNEYGHEVAAKAIEGYLLKNALFSPR